MGEERPALTVEAVPATGRGFSLRRVLRVGLTWGRSELGDDLYPSVVARNARGQEFRLFGAATWDEATAKRDRLRRELGEVDLDVWCDRYVVPGDFVRGDWPPD